MKDDIRARSPEEQAALLSAIVESSPDLIWTCDADMRVTFCNAAIEGLLGYGAEEMIGGSLIDLVHPDDREMALRVVSQAIEAKVGWRGIRARLVCKDGLIRHAESSAKPLLDGQGDLRRFSGGNRDITDRVLAEQGLSEHQKRLEMITDHSSDGIDVVVVDAETGKHRLVMCNDRYVEMSGYSRRQLMAADDVRQLERVVSVSADYMDRKAQGLSRGGTSSWIRPDGKENYYEWVAYPITIDGKCHVVGIDREITDRVIADRGLREHQRRLEMILKYSFDGISICTVDMQTGNRKLVMCNDRFVEMSGRGRDELLAVADIGQFVDLDEQAPSLLESIVRGKAACGLGSWKRPDGAENHHDWTAVPLEIAGRTHLVGIDRDVTENVRRQRQMQEANDRLRNIVYFLPEAAFVIDRDKTVIAWNREMENLTGVHEREVIGKGGAAYRKAMTDTAEPTLIDLIDNTDQQLAERVESLCGYLKREAGRMLAEMRQPAREGKPERYLWLSASPVLDGSGKVIGAIQIIRDHTAAHLAERKSAGRRDG